MPITSKAQQRLMYATAAGAKTGVSKAVAKKYIEETPKASYGRMPKRRKAVMRRKPKPMTGA